MTEPLRAQMEGLRSIAPRLNKTSDAAATAIRAVESFLNDTKIGVPGMAIFREDSVGEDGTDGRLYQDRYYLAYGRHLGNFCIHIVRFINEVDRDGDVIQTMNTSSHSWSTLTRQDKLRSVAALPELLRDIYDEAQKIAGEAEAAIETVYTTLATLGVDAYRADVSAPVDTPISTGVVGPGRVVELL